MYKLFAVTTLLALGLTLSGCGKGSGNVNGTWTADLGATPTTPTIFAFQTTIAGGGGGAFQVTSFTFTTAGPCFTGNTTTETGSVSLSGDYNGHVAGSFALMISTMFPVATNNVLTLKGTVADNTITGTWTLVGGTGCTGSGVFTATRA